MVASFWGWLFVSFPINNEQARFQVLMPKTKASGSSARGENDILWVG
jgi:hypothetical protein